MKQKDITLIAVIAIVAGIISVVISQIFLATPKNLQQEVEVVQPISSEFNDEDENLKKNIFNDQALNPTRLIQITENKNENPFKEEN